MTKYHINTGSAKMLLEEQWGQSEKIFKKNFPAKQK
jgi:hypothetical protein